MKLDGSVLFANRAARDLLGLPEDDAALYDHFEEDATEVAAKIRRGAGSDLWQPIKLTVGRGPHKGVRIDLRCRGMPDRESGELHAVLITDDARRHVFAEHRRLIARLNAELAEQRKMRLRLDASLLNETKLHQELIHRVKNNLSLLASLIRIRSSGAKEPPVKTALDEILARVMSIGLVHELLDREKQIDVVDAAVLLESLCAQMESSICPPGVTISREIEPYKRHVSDATPLALLVNELVTNALKHAFVGTEGGVVDIRLKRNGVDKIEVHVRDNGAGFADAGKGHGTRIVQGLAATLDGELSVSSQDGTSWQLVFAPSQTATLAAG